MRSRTIPAFVAVVALAAGALASTQASAQLKVGGGGVEVAGPNNTAAVQGAGDAVTVRETRRQGGQTLRCWQNGRLLYEGSGFRAGAGGPNAISVPRRTDGEPVTVLNLQHAICILSES